MEIERNYPYCDYDLLLTALKRKMVNAKPCITGFIADRHMLLAAGNFVVWLNRAILQNTVSLTDEGRALQRLTQTKTETCRVAARLQEAVSLERTAVASC